MRFNIEGEKIADLSLKEKLRIKSEILMFSGILSYLFAVSVTE